VSLSISEAYVVTNRSSDRLAISLVNKQTDPSVCCPFLHKSLTRSGFYRHLFSKNFHCVTSKLSLDVLASRLRRSINRVHVPPEKTVCACLITLVLVVLRRGSLPGGMYMHSSTTGGMYMHSSTTIFSCLHPTSPWPLTAAQTGYGTHI